MFSGMEMREWKTHSCAWAEISIKMICASENKESKESRWKRTKSELEVLETLYSLQLRNFAENTTRIRGNWKLSNVLYQSSDKLMNICLREKEQLSNFMNWNFLNMMILACEIFIVRDSIVEKLVLVRSYETTLGTRERSGEKDEAYLVVMMSTQVGS